MSSHRTDFSSSDGKKRPSLTQWFSNNWLRAAYGSAKWIYIFYPLSLLFYFVSGLRKYYLIFFRATHLSVPVIVIGNITLGGTGKTPLLIALVKHFQTQGRKVGVVSRGYGGKAEEYPCLIDQYSTVEQVGDEPRMIYNRTAALVCVGSNRVASAKKLIELGCDIILSDDGLQHYQLARDVEILVVDAVRQFGNQQLIPTGPLRESIKRITSVDFIFINETQSASPDFRDQLLTRSRKESVNHFVLAPQHFVQVCTGKTLSIADFISICSSAQKPVQLIAGIGNPDGFFSSLNKIGISGVTRSFPDHHAFVANDFHDFGDAVVVMTEKDAVKVKSFAQPNWYYLESGVELEQSVLQQLDNKISSLKK